MKIILGDNPFFGVNHSKGGGLIESQHQRFTNAASVAKKFVSEGGQVMMLSNHLAAAELLHAFRREHVPDLDIALVVPYPHKYNDIVASKGYLGLMKALISGNVRNFVMAGINFCLGQNFKKWCLKALINSELNGFREHLGQVRYICLHNIITDMFVAGKNAQLLNDFIDLIHDKGFEPVIITQNPTYVSASVDRASYTLCFSLNSVGYMVNPDLETVVDFVKNLTSKGPTIWAMQVLASGEVNPSTALSFIESLENVDGVLYATTKPDRVASFFAESEMHTPG